MYKRQGEPDLEERLSELRKVKFEGQVEAGLELLKALTDRGSGRLKNLDARLEKLDGQIREQAAYLEKVRQNGKRRKELEERKKEREQFLPVLQAAAGAWEEMCIRDRLRPRRPGRSCIFMTAGSL